MNQKIELLKCPFCGGEAELLIVPGYFKQGLSSSGWVVKCLNGCCNQMPFQSDHDAVEAWNRRDVRDAIMQEPTLDQIREYCKKRRLVLITAELYDKLTRTAQPEQLTDKEQRIFLAAMGREEKVCKQVDDERRDCRKPYEDSLVKTCHEITRKVKGVLWT